MDKIIARPKRAQVGTINQPDGDKVGLVADTKQTTRTTLGDDNCETVVRPTRTLLLMLRGFVMKFAKIAETNKADEAQVVKARLQRWVLTNIGMPSIIGCSQGKIELILFNQKLIRT